MNDRGVDEKVGGKIAVEHSPSWWNAALADRSRGASADIDKSTLGGHMVSILNH